MMLDLEASSFGSLESSLVWIPFNPTAENIAKYLVEVIGPQQLQGTGVKLVECIVEETSKCSASYSLKG
jgi:6-pyruvoyltetrahydropterin/6-carboxytetrahydropterin synthase